MDNPGAGVVKPSKSADEQKQSPALGGDTVAQCNMTTEMKSQARDTPLDCSTLLDEYSSSIVNLLTEASALKSDLQLSVAPDTRNIPKGTTTKSETFDSEENLNDEPSNKVSDSEENTHEVDQSDHPEVIIEIKTEIQDEEANISESCQDNNSAIPHCMDDVLTSKKTNLQQEHSQQQLAMDPLNKSMDSLNKSVDQLNKTNRQKSATRKDPNKIDAPTSFSNTSMLRLRTHLMEVLEELKMRRVTDKENEDRLNQLMTEKHLLYSKHEECLINIENLNENNETCLAALKKDYQQKLKDVQQTQQKLQITIDNHVKETKYLKDEIRNLQVTRYNLDKQVKEQDRRIHLRESLQDNSLSQLTAVENRCKDMVNQMQQLVMDQDKLQKNVQEACKLNRKLAYVVEHHSCEVDMYKSEISDLKDTVVQLHLQLDKKPREIQAQVREKDELNTKLKQQIQASENTIKNLKKCVEQGKEQLQVTESQLKISNDLVSRHVKLDNQKTEESCNLQVKLSELTETHTKLTKAYDAKNKDLEVEKTSNQELQRQWKIQEESLQSRLITLQEDLEALGKTHANLEELNTKWATKNTALTQEISAIKEELSQPKNDVATQIIIETTTLDTQTVLNTNDIDTQTNAASYMSSLGMQTNKLQATDVFVQTDDIVSDLKVKPSTKLQLGNMEEFYKNIKPCHAESSRSSVNIEKSEVKLDKAADCIQHDKHGSIECSQLPLCSDVHVIPDSQPGPMPSNNTETELSISEQLEHPLSVVPPHSVCTASDHSKFTSRYIWNHLETVSDVNVENNVPCFEKGPSVNADTLSSSQPTYPAPAHGDHAVDITGRNTNSEPIPGIDYNFDGTYSKITSTLKSIASMFSPGRSGKSKKSQKENVGAITKKRRIEDSDVPVSPAVPLTSAVSLNPAIPPSPAVSSVDVSTGYNFQFVHSVTEPNEVLDSAQQIEPNTPEIYSPADVLSSGILLDRRRSTRKSKSVSFSKKLEHHSDSPQSPTLHGDFKQLINEDNGLFSEDEGESFEIGSQVERITKFLGHDRLRSSHTATKQ